MKPSPVVTLLPMSPYLVTEVTGMCRYFHATRRDCLDSIREHGLLRPMDADELPHEIRYVGLSSEDAVYLMDSKHDDTTVKQWRRRYFTAERYVRDWGDVTLCLDHLPTRSVVKDHILGYPAIEVHSRIPAKYLRIHCDFGQCEPLVKGNSNESQS